MIIGNAAARLAVAVMASALVAVCPAVRAADRTVELTITLNGTEIPPPDNAILDIEGQEIRIPIVDGRIEAPESARRGEAAALELRIGRERIRIPKPPGAVFDSEHWTLMLAERRYEKRYQRELPSWLSVRHSCIVRLESTRGDTTLGVYYHCRSELK